MGKIIQIESIRNGYEYLCAIPEISFGIYISPLIPAKEFCKRVNTRFESGELKLADPVIFDKLMNIANENLSSL